MLIIILQVYIQSSDIIRNTDIDNYSKSAWLKYDTQKTYYYIRRKVSNTLINRLKLFIPY